MLAIHHRLPDRMKNVKAITAGAVAFGIGLTAAAAYVGATMVYDNFSYGNADKKASSKVAGASTSSETKAENGQQGISGSGASSTASGSAGVTGAPSAGSIGTATVVGGRGAGTATPTVTSPAPTPTVTISPAPAPSPTPVIVVPPAPDPTDCLCGVLTPVNGTVNGVVDALGL